MRMVVILLTVLISCSHRVKIVASPKENPRHLHEAVSARQMLTTQGEASTKAALEIFEMGGNIIDAFVATSFTISVERPQSTGIGGGGFLVYFSKKDKKVYAFDFREVAPRASYENMFLSKTGEAQPLVSQEGALAVAVPGLVAGLYDIHKRFGKLPWSVTIQPAFVLGFANS